MRRARVLGAFEEHTAVRSSRVAGRSAALVCTALLCALLALAGGARMAGAKALPTGSRAPGGNFSDPAVRAVDIDAPSVVRVGTEEQATLTLQLCTRSITLPPGGGSYDVAGTGSGAFISSSGDILTADHVVHLPDDEVLYFAADDVASVLNDLSQYDPGCALSGGAVSADDIANGLIDLKYTTHVSGLHSIVWLSTAYSGPIDASTLKDAPALPATVETSSPYTEDDLAIVHVDLSDTPSIAIGDSDNVAVEDHLTVIGFPGNGDVTDSADNMLTPSVNAVMVSAIKENDNGSPLIQVGGNVEHGDSGAPLLNAQGQVVGVVSFAGADPQGETSFMRATSSAQPLLAGQNISTAPGHFQLAWTQAFDAYAASYPGHWHDAQAKMETLADAYPQFKALDLYLAYARTAAAQEQVPSNSLPTNTLLIAGGAAILVVLILALALILVLRARGKRKARALAQIAPAYPAAYPSAVPQPYGPPTSQPYPPYANPPYPPTFGTWPSAPESPAGQPPISAHAGAFAAPATTTAPGSTQTSAPPPTMQGWEAHGWNQSPTRDGSPGSSAASGARPPDTPASWAWHAAQRPHGSDAYNRNGGVDSADASGH